MGENAVQIKEWVLDGFIVEYDQKDSDAANAVELRKPVLHNFLDVLYLLGLSGEAPCIIQCSSSVAATQELWMSPTKSVINNAEFCY